MSDLKLPTHCLTPLKWMRSLYRKNASDLPGALHSCHSWLRTDLLGEQGESHNIKSSTTTFSIPIGKPFATGPSSTFFSIPRFRSLQLQVKQKPPTEFTTKTEDFDLFEISREWKYEWSCPIEYHYTQFTETDVDVIYLLLPKGEEPKENHLDLSCFDPHRHEVSIFNMQSKATGWKKSELWKNAITTNSKFRHRFVHKQ